MAINRLLEIAYDEAGKQEGPDAALWKHPGIAPEGYIDFVRGDSFFPVYGSPQSIVFCVAKPGSPSSSSGPMRGWVETINGNDDESTVRATVARAFEQFRKLKT
jgi:hypothetical protein